MNIIANLNNNNNIIEIIRGKYINFIFYLLDILLILLQRIINIESRIERAKNSPLNDS